MNKLEIEELYGFERVGEWKSDERSKSGITFELEKFKGNRVIYAFVVDSEVKYIGVCENTTTTLKDRMSRYKNLQGGGTNERIAKEIKTCLKQGKSVKIFALRPPASEYKYKDLNIDLVKGLENPLIEKLKPAWNIQNK
jgi:hypothetical protein